MRKLLFTIIFSVAATFIHAQEGTSLSAKDYEHAEQFLSYNTQPYIDRANVNPNWLAGDRFWYRVLTKDGSEFVLVDPVKGTKGSAFNQQSLAEAISKTTGQTITASGL